MKLWKIMSIICAAMVVSTIVICLCCRLTVKDAGISDIRDIGGYLEYCSGVPIKAIDRKAVSMAEFILSNKDKYKTGVSSEGLYVHHDLQVFVVEKVDMTNANDETIFQLPGEVAQDVKVVKVLQGDNIEGEYINLYGIGGILIQYDNSIVNMGVNWKNVMLPGNQYLVFCECVENMQELENCCGYPLKYRLIYSLFNQLNITRDMTQLLNEDGTCSDWSNIEFFTYNSDTLDALLEIKREILKEYGLKVGDSI
ncbi:MAG: hypothetical protein K6F92_03850 [Lachnospiraceae bacterium]|nr:hypothetical protein [Lachnospiraceae bacterium]